MDDLSKLKTPEYVQEFDRSKVVRDAVRLLGEFQDASLEKIPTQPKLTTVRDYLLTLLCINNGSRSGSLSNMTLGEYKKAHKDKDDFVVKVKKHKTFTTHGLAHIAMSSLLYRWVGIFVTELRNKLGNVNKHDNVIVFITWSLRQMNSSQTGVEIGSCWSKVFGKSASGGGTTSFRKAAVSAVQKQNEHGRGDLASLTVHHKETTDLYYLLQSKVKQAANASCSLTGIMHFQRLKTPTDELKVAGRYQWTDDQEQLLSDLFKTEIKGRKITLDRVVELTKNHPVLSKLESVKIRDKIRHIYIVRSLKRFHHFHKKPKQLKIA